ncbi:MAG: hypothetical protein KDE27_21860 [Planctomycetes bacterium]|nr:hypothetical protein [Planctomycetota bacterium]
MRHAPAILIALAAAACLAPTCSAQGGRSRGEAPKLEHLIHEEAEFDSAAVGHAMPYGVYLPLDYHDESAKDKKYPLVIWLHGMWEDHDRFHMRGGGRILDKAVGDGLVPPCVFVLANGGRTSMYINAGEGKEYQDLIQHDLLDHVQKTYRVRDERDQRALMGISMGGMAAMRIAWQHPDLFGTVAVHSSAVFPPDPKQLPPRLLQLSSRFGLDDVFGNPIDEDLWRATNPLGIAAGLKPADLHGMRFYFDAGTDDRWNMGPTNEALHELLEKRKIPHTFELVKGGGHAWGSGFKDECLETSLKFVGDMFRGDAVVGSVPAKATAPAGGDAAPAAGSNGGSKRDG